jgi:hypothetical protein
MAYPSPAEIITGRYLWLQPIFKMIDNLSRAPSVYLRKTAYVIIDLDFFYHLDPDGAQPMYVFLAHLRGAYAITRRPSYH